jgi:hypothetical protein
MYKYSSNSIAFASEVGIVAAGPIANIVIFMVMVLAGAMFYRVRSSIHLSLRLALLTRITFSDLLFLLIVVFWVFT